MWLVAEGALLFVGRTRDGLVVSSPIAGDIERALPAAVVMEDPAARVRYFARASESDVRALALRLAVGVRTADLASSVSDPVRRAGYLRALGALCDAFGGHGRLGWRRTRTARPKDAYLHGERAPRELSGAP